PLRQTGYYRTRSIEGLSRRNLRTRAASGTHQIRYFLHQSLVSPPRPANRACDNPPNLLSTKIGLLSFCQRSSILHFDKLRGTATCTRLRCIILRNARSENRFVS